MFFKSSSSIELFGVSGCGKSFIRDKIIKLLKKSNNKVLDSRELIIFHSKRVINLNLVEKQILNYRSNFASNFLRFGPHFGVHFGDRIDEWAPHSSNIFAAKRPAFLILIKSFIE